MMMASEAVSADHEIDTPQGRMFARVWRPANDGGAAPIILLHDSIGCVALWRDFPMALSVRTGRRVIAYDRIGFGQSDPYNGRLPLDFMHRESREALSPLLAACGVEDFVLFGHSVGGGMAVAAAANHGARCVALITESAQLFSESVTFDGVRAARAAFAPGSSSYARLTTHHGAKTDWVLSSWIDTWLDPGFVLDLEPLVRSLACPVLALHGDGDAYGSIAQPQWLCDRVPGVAVAHVLSGCGHVPHRERPAEVLDAVASLLSV